MLDTKQMLDDARITAQRAALADTAGQAFCNTSRFTLRDLKSRGNYQQLLADFEDYLNGFSPNLQDSAHGYGPALHGLKCASARRLFDRASQPLYLLITCL